MKIRCEKCYNLLGKFENGWVQVKGKVDVSSNGEEFKIVCRCGEEKIIKIK